MNAIAFPTLHHFHRRDAEKTIKRSKRQSAITLEGELTHLASWRLGGSILFSAPLRLGGEYSVDLQNADFLLSARTSSRDGRGIDGGLGRRLGDGRGIFYCFFKLWRLLEHKFRRHSTIGDLCSQAVLIHHCL